VASKAGGNRGHSRERRKVRLPGGLASKARGAPKWAPRSGWEARSRGNLARREQAQLVHGGAQRAQRAIAAPTFERCPMNHPNSLSILLRYYITCELHCEASTLGLAMHCHPSGVCCTACTATAFGCWATGQENGLRQES